MAVASWRRERIWNVERVSLDLEIAKETQHVRHDELTAIAFSKLANESRTLDLIHRYETRYERQYLRAHKRLLEVQAARNKDEGPDHPAPAVSSPNVIPIDRPPSESISAKGTQADPEPETLIEVDQPSSSPSCPSSSGDKFPEEESASILAEPSEKEEPSQNLPNEPGEPGALQP
jgi:hypothetical protein